MPKTNKPSALPISGKVTARSDYGIKIEGIEDWLNWSREEYRKEPWEADDVEKGDWVDLEVSGKYIKSVALVEPPATEPMVRALEDAEGGGRGLVSRELAEEDPFEGMDAEPASPQERRARSPIATDRERSIQRQVALYAAVQLAVGMAKPVEGQQPGPLTADWVIQIYRKFRVALQEKE